MWLEQPELITALARLTGVGLLGYSLIQRQVRLSLLPHDQQVPGNKGTTATPTAAVVLVLFIQVTLIPLGLGNHEVVQMYGIQPHPLLIWDALGLDHSWYEAHSVQKNRSVQSDSLNVGCMEEATRDRLSCPLSVLPLCGRRPHAFAEGFQRFVCKQCMGCSRRMLIVPEDIPRCCWYPKFVELLWTTDVFKGQGIAI